MELRPPIQVAALCLGLLALLLLYIAGGPILTDDLWWHVKMGEVYTTEGPWPAGDPLLHTAHADAPVQHEWLFGVPLHAIDRVFGLHGLRVAHVLAVIGILVLVFSVFRRESRSDLAACAAACIFLVLSTPRLAQLRPDLVTIPMTILLYRLLIEPERPPSWARVASATAILLVWANMHSVFAVVFPLLAAALVGLAARHLLRRWPGFPGEERPESGQNEISRIKRVGAASLLGLAATTVNPRGIEQHLSFFAFSESHGIRLIEDEFTPFDPFRFDYTLGISRLSWLVTDVLLVAFLGVAAFGAFRLLRRPSSAALERVDPVLGALACASFLAMFGAIRFLWMCVFPLLFLLRAGRLSGSLRSGRAAWALACACLALVALYPYFSSFPRFASTVQSEGRDYLVHPYVREKYHVAGVRFLRDTAVEGNLFNAYHMGGFLGYWLAPALRTSIDGRSGSYTEQVLQEYMLIDSRRRTRSGETFLQALDRMQVDLFFGIGVGNIDSGRGAPHTMNHLAGQPGWLPVSRSVHHAIHLRANDRNHENLRRIAEYYAEQGVPFSSASGLDVALLIRSRPDWAMEHEIVPRHYRELQDALDSGDPEAEFRARDELGLIYALLGMYREQIENDERAAALRPEAKGPRRRLAYALLRLDRPQEAQKAARQLRSIDPDDPLSLRVRDAVEQYLQRRRYERVHGREAPDGTPAAVLADRFPLVSTQERQRLGRDFHFTTMGRPNR